MKAACPTFLILSLGLSLPSSAENPPTLLQSALKTHCVKCHGAGRKIQGKVNRLALESGEKRCFGGAMITFDRIPESCRHR